jgi:hypothetical protein
MSERRSEQLNEFQKTGGAAALVMAGTFVIGFAMYFGVLAGSAWESNDPGEVVSFLVDYKSIMTVWHLIIYVIFGIALVVLSLSLHERLKASASATTQTATAFGLIWAGLVIASGMIAVVGMGVVVDLDATDPAQAGSVWTAISAVQFGIGGGVEIVGALWLLLISWAALQAGEFPRALSYFGITVGAAGVLTIVPAFEIFGAFFGLGSIVWFVWIGLMMLTASPATGNQTTPRPSMTS